MTLFGNTVLADDLRRREETHKREVHVTTEAEIGLMQL